MPDVDATGGNFSVGYVAEDGSGRQGWVKALDFARAFAEEDPTTALEELTAGYNYERLVLDKCRTSRLTRIVQILEDGRVSPEGDYQIPSVSFLVFERASFDVRELVGSRGWENPAEPLRTLHEVALGLQQLHKTGLAHQDLKPSNVLVFDAEGSKLGDLGRAAYRGHQAPFDPREDLAFAGDPTYAPPEAMYGLRLDDWSDRCLSHDAYLLGSMVLFLFSSVAMTPALFAFIDESLWPRNFAGSYDDVLPYLRAALDEVIEAAREDFPRECAPALASCVHQLCEPDVVLRGHPRNRAGVGSKYSLERYVSLFNLLSYRAAIEWGVAS